SAELPIMPLIRTPDGYEVSQLQIQDMRRGKESLTISLTPHVSRRGRMEWVCWDGQDRWNVGPWEQQPERDRGGVLRLTLRAVTRTIGGVDFVGFSYAYRFRSRKYRIYRIHDRATWELGGYATGNSFWMRGPFNEPQKTLRNKSDDFTTSWCRSADGALQLQQFLPFFTVLQGFTFQFDRQNLLVTAFEEPFHCRSLCQKNSGQNYFVHWHQLCGDLSGCLEFPPLQVLCAENDGHDATELASRYCAIREDLQRAYAEQCGLAREGAVVGSRLVIGEAQCFETLLRAVDELAHCGCDRVYAPGLVRRFGSGTDGTAEGGSSSQPRREAWEQVSRFVEHAHQRGMEVATSLADCCAPWLVAAARAEATDDAPGEAPGDELLLRALRDGHGRREFLDHMRRVRKQLGVDALFADSMLDGIGDQFDWVWPAIPDGSGKAAGPAGAPDFDEAAGEIVSLQTPKMALVAALQRMGYRCPLAGVSGLGGPHSSPDFGMLRDREFMFRDQVVDFPHDAIAESGEDPLAAYFRGCAHRLGYATVYDGASGVGGRLADWWKQEYGAVNKAFHAVREHMEHSRLLPQDAGVLWTGVDPEVRVLWCCKRFAWKVGPKAEVFDVMASARVEAEDGRFSPRPYRVYLVQNAEGP
ncbi:MAG: hypothetical protein ACYS8L_00660, partial [Planctomycetota bacterium]